MCASMDIDVAIELAERLHDWLIDVECEHEAYKDDPEGDLPEALQDIDVYCDGGYCNLDDAESTADSLLTLLKELKVTQPKLAGNYDNYGRLRR